MVISSSSHPSFKECSFEGNQGSYGGTMVLDTNGQVTVLQCIFNANSAAWAGGVFYLAQSGISPILQVGAQA